jgi:hypothetical protein
LKVRRKKQPWRRKKVIHHPIPKARAVKWEAPDVEYLKIQETISVQASVLVAKHDHDAAVWTSTAPCDSVELRVTWTDAIRLQFVFSPIHPGLDELEVRDGDHCHVVLCETPFLKGHGVHIQWAPRDGTAVASGRGTTALTALQAAPA